jgi:hypothetical protein
MLNRKAVEVTNQITGRLHLPESTQDFLIIQTIILKSFEEVYLQGRRDQVNRLDIIVDKDNRITFPFE